VAGARSLGSLLAFGLCAFTATAVISEFLRGSRGQRAREGITWVSALGRTLLRNRRRYGGYVVHLGIVLIAIGIAGAAFRTERQVHIPVGGTMELGEYRLTYEDLQRDTTPEKQIFAATIEVTRDGEPIATLSPQRNLHLAQQQWQSEVAIRTTPIEDLYVVITAIDPDGAASVRAFLNPLTWWIWAGAAVMAAGMGVILSGATPVAAEARARARVREQVVTAP
jgi:cytochrome c-type biogenesis protein CcmF